MPGFIYMDMPFVYPVRSLDSLRRSVFLLEYDYSCARVDTELSPSLDIDSITASPLTLLPDSHETGKSPIYPSFTTYISDNQQISSNKTNNNQYGWKSPDLCCWIIIQYGRLRNYVFTLPICLFVMQIAKLTTACKSILPTNVPNQLTTSTNEQNHLMQTTNKLNQLILPPNEPNQLTPPSDKPSQLIQPPNELNQLILPTNEPNQVIPPPNEPNKLYYLRMSRISLYSRPMSRIRSCHLQMTGTSSYDLQMS